MTFVDLYVNARREREDRRQDRRSRNRSAFDAPQAVAPSAASLAAGGGEPVDVAPQSLRRLGVPSRYADEPYSAEVAQEAQDSFDRFAAELGTNQTLGERVLEGIEGDNFRLPALLAAPVRAAGDAVEVAALEPFAAFNEDARVRRDDRRQAISDSLEGMGRAIGGLRPGTARSLEERAADQAREEEIYQRELRRDQRFYNELRPELGISQYEWVDPETGESENEIVIAPQRSALRNVAGRAGAFLDDMVGWEARRLGMDEPSRQYAIADTLAEQAAAAGDTEAEAFYRRQAEDAGGVLGLSQAGGALEFSGIGLLTDAARGARVAGRSALRAATPGIEDADMPRFLQRPVEPFDAGPMTEQARASRNSALLTAGGAGLLGYGGAEAVEDIELPGGFSGEDLALGAGTAIAGVAGAAGLRRLRVGQNALRGTPEAVQAVAGGRQLAAIRDPETGMVLVGPTHIDVIIDAEDLAARGEIDPEVVARISTEYSNDMNGPNIGFARGDTFMDREAAMSALGDRAIAGLDEPAPTPATPEPRRLGEPAPQRVRKGQAPHPATEQILELGPTMSAPEIAAQIGGGLSADVVRRILARNGITPPQAARAGRTGSRQALAARNARILQILNEVQPTITNKGGKQPRENSFAAIAAQMQREGYTDVTSSVVAGVVKRNRDLNAPQAAADATAEAQRISERTGIPLERVLAISARRRDGNPTGAIAALGAGGGAALAFNDAEARDRGDTGEVDAARAEVERIQGQERALENALARISQATNEQERREATRALQVMIGAAPDGIFMSQTSAAAQARSRELRADREAAQTRLRSIEADAAMAAARPDPFLESVYKYGPLVAASGGLAVAHLTRANAIRAAARRLGQENAAIDARIPQGAPPLRLDAASAQERASRVGALNDLWAQGGAAPERAPFVADPEGAGFRANPQAAPASSLFQEDRSLLSENSRNFRPNDATTIALGAAEGTIAWTVAVPYLEAELERAEAAAAADPTSQSLAIQVEDARRNLAIAKGVGSFGLGLAGGRLIMARHPYEHMRPNVAAMEGQQIELNRFLANQEDIARGAANEAVGRPPEAPIPSTLEGLDQIGPGPSRTYRLRGEPRQQANVTERGSFLGPRREWSNEDLSNVLARVRRSPELSDARTPEDVSNVTVLARQLVVEPVYARRTGKLDERATLERIFRAAQPETLDNALGARLTREQGARAARLRELGLWATSEVKDGIDPAITPPRAGTPPRRRLGDATSAALLAGAGGASLAFSDEAEASDGTLPEDSGLGDAALPLGVLGAGALAAVAARGRLGQIGRQASEAASPTQVYRPNQYTEVYVEPDGRVVGKYQGSWEASAGAPEEVAAALQSGSAQEARTLWRGIEQALKEDIATNQRPVYYWTPGNERLAEFYRAALRSRTPEGYVFSEGPDGVMSLTRRGPEQQGDLFPETAPSPLQAYHGTFNEFGEFAPMQHFGTRRAAEQRLGAVRNDGYGAAAPADPTQQGRVIPVEITGRRVNVGEEISGPGGATRPSDVADMLLRSRLISEDDYAYITEPLQDGATRYLGRNAQEVVSERLMEVTARNDIGAIGYRNAYEDAGSTSYIVPDGQMVRRLGEEGVTAPRAPRPVTLRDMRMGLLDAAPNRIEADIDPRLILGGGAALVPPVGALTAIGLEEWRPWEEQFGRENEWLRDARRRTYELQDQAQRWGY